MLFPPLQVDTLMMKHFLSAFSDEDCLIIVKHCRQVLAPGGSILLLQTLVPEAGDRSHNSCEDGVAAGMWQRQSSLPYRASWLWGVTGACCCNWLFYCCRLVLLLGASILLLQRLVPQAGDGSHNSCEDGISAGTFHLCSYC